MLKLLEQQRMNGITISFSERDNKFLFESNMPNGQRHYVDRDQIAKARRRLEDRLRKDPLAVFRTLDNLGMICSSVFE